MPIPAPGIPPGCRHFHGGIDRPGPDHSRRRWQAARRPADGELVRILRRLFGERTIEEALIDLLVPSYDTESRVPRYFEKRPALGNWDEPVGFRAWEVARAATAAPTYFVPARIRGLPDTGRTWSLIDGGVFTNNPSLCAYAAARRLYPQARRFTILSLGTGNAEQPYRYEQMRTWGSLDWLSPRKGLPLIDMMLDGQSDEACWPRCLRYGCSVSTCPWSASAPPWMTGTTWNTWKLWPAIGPGSNAGRWTRSAWR